MSAPIQLQDLDDNPIKFEEAELACFPAIQHFELIHRAAQFPASTYFGRGFRGLARRAMDAYIDATPSLTKIPQGANLLDVWEDLLLRAYHDSSQRPGHPSLLAMHLRKVNTTPGAALREAVYDWLAVGRIFLLGDLIEAAPWQPFFDALKEPNRRGYRAEISAELDRAPGERTWPIIDNQSILAERLQAPPSETKAASRETIPPPGETIGVPRGTLALPAAIGAAEPAQCCKDYPWCPCPEIPKILPVKIVDEVKPRWRYKRAT
jgi:hypothetical protein